MLPDRVSNPGPLTYESGDLPIALRGRAIVKTTDSMKLHTENPSTVNFNGGKYSRACS